MGEVEGGVWLNGWVRWRVRWRGEVEGRLWLNGWVTSEVDGGRVKKR